MTTNWSPQQEAALRTIKAWWNNGKPANQELLLFGYAGTGKTTLAKELPELLDLEIYRDEEPSPEATELHECGPDDPNDIEQVMEFYRAKAKHDRCLGLLLYCSFTGKAASVLRSKGLNAFTIHQSIYGKPIIDEQKLNQLVEECNRYEATGDSRLGTSIMELKRACQPGFGIKSVDARVTKCRLIVVDECSMIDEKLYLDLGQFGIPIIFMGDPAQLPPVGKSAGLIERTPDIMLTEIHRQALDNPILELATSLRTSSVLPKIVLPNLVVTNQPITVAQMAEFDQTIVGYHTSRRRINNSMRQHFNFDELPKGKGEKLINLKNDHQLKIMNGEMIELTDIADDGMQFFFMGRMLDYYTKRKLGDELSTLQTIYDGYFRDTVNFREGRINREWRERKEAVEVDWGYAITCHKSQGSEWDSIYVHDDGFGRSELDRCRWLYTALTRARSSAFIYSRFAV